MAATASRTFELGLLDAGYPSLIGLDEVGRGCVAGEVTVGAAMIDRSTGDAPAGLADSKLLTASRREALVAPLLEWTAGRLAVGHATAAEIDRYGIIGGLRLAGYRALSSLPAPGLVLLDGSHNWLHAPDGWVDEMLEHGTLTQRPEELTVQTKVKADRDVTVVAAASVYAKTVRDGRMTELDATFPAYGFSQHKGYLTAAHTAALRAHGPCDAHRRSFTLPQ
jgi:ribonuclease HII